MGRIDEWPWTARVGAILAVAGLAVSACQGTTPLGPMRVETTPPDLEYIPSEELRSTMWTLAGEIRYLEQLLDETDEAPDDSSHRLAVRASLARMERAARRLDRSGRSSQHPVLNRHLGQFLTRLERAQRATEHEPPNYYPASTIAGSCFLCHGGERADSTSDRSYADRRVPNQAIGP